MEGSIMQVVSLMSAIRVIWKERNMHHFDMKSSSDKSLVERSSST